MSSNQSVQIKNSNIGVYIDGGKDVRVKKVNIKTLPQQQNFEVPPLINTFTGRENEFNKLESLFFNEDITQIKKKVVLCGIPGIGKSELAKQFANKCEIEGKVSRVYYVLVDDTNKISEIFVRIKEICEKAKTNKYLFVLDNAISRKTFAKYELSSNHFFLITSQKKEWGLNFETLELAPLSVESAVNFYEMKLKENYNNQDKNLYMIIATFVGCVPLGLQITGAYIREAKMIHVEDFLQKYIETLRKSKDEVVEQNFPPSADNPYERSIYGAIKVSIDKISSDKDIKHPYLALTSLYDCCYLDPTSIDTKLLLSLSNIHNILQNENYTTLNLKRSLILLDNFSLIHFKKSKNIEIHRFTQKVLRLHLAKSDPGRQYECYSSCLEILLKCKENYYRDGSINDADIFKDEDEYSDGEPNENCWEATEAEIAYFRANGYDVDTEYEDDSDEDDYDESKKITKEKKVIPKKPDNEEEDVDWFDYKDFNSEDVKDNVHEEDQLDQEITDELLFGDSEPNTNTNDEVNISFDPYWVFNYDFLIPKILQHADENFDAFTSFYKNNKYILLNDTSETSFLRHIMDNLVENGCTKCIEFMFDGFDSATLKHVAKFILSYRAYQRRLYKTLKFLLKFDGERKKRDHAQLINEAAIDGDFEMLTVLLEYNPELLYSTWLGETPIFEYFRGIYELKHTYTYSKMNNVLDVLKCKENINMRDHDFNTVLHVATKLFSEDVVELLLTKYGMNINARNVNGNTPLHYFINVSSSAKKKVVNKVTKVFLLHGASLTIQNNFECTPLEYAYSTRSYASEILFYFSNSTKDFRKEKHVLHSAVFRNNLEKVVTILKDKEIDVNYLDEDLDTALHLAAIEWNFEAMKILLQHKADFNIRNNNGNTALFNFFLGARYIKFFHIQFEKAHEILKLLELDKHTHDINNKNETLLHLAASSLHEELVELLVENYNIDINKQDSEGNTPLHSLIIELSKYDCKILAEYEKIYKIIIKLKMYGASLDKVNNKGMSVIELAQVYKQDNVLIDLLIDDNNIDRITILSEAQLKELVNKHQLLLYCIKYNQIGSLILLLNLNININMQTKKLNTALHAACIVGNLEAIKILTDYNADLNLKNKYGDIPLFSFIKSAAEHDHLNIIEKEQILDVLHCKDYKDVTGSSGKTILHIAVKLLQVDLVELLLTKYDFNVNKTDTRNNTPLHKLTNQFMFINYLHPPNLNKMLKIANILKQNGAFIDTTSAFSIKQNNNLDCDREIDYIVHTAISFIVLFDEEDTIIEKLSKLFQNLGENSSRYISNLSLIHYAIAMNYINLLNKLIELDVWNIIQTASHKVTPLHVAAFKWNFRAVRILTHCEAKLHEEDLDGNTPLFTFFKGGLEQNKINIERANKILDLLGIKSNHNVVHKSGKTLLHQAVCSFQPDLIELLITNYKLNVNAQDLKGRTPLHKLILKLAKEDFNTTKRRLRILSTAVSLRLNGASTEIKDENGFTPIELAYRTKVSYILIYLLFNDKYVEDLRNIFKKLDDTTKATIFKSYILQNALQLDQLDVLDLLLEYSPDVNCKDEDEDTLLHFAASTWNLKAIQILIKHNADLTLKNNFGRTALEEFLEAPRFDDVNTDNMRDILTLLKCEETKFENSTPLHSAALSLNADLVDVLLNEYKFNINSLDEKNHTPLHIFLWSLTKPHDKKVEDVIHTLEILLNGSCLGLEIVKGMTPYEFAENKKLDYLLPYLVNIDKESEVKTIESEIGFTGSYVAFCSVVFYLYFTYFLIVNLL